MKIDRRRFIRDAGIVAVGLSLGDRLAGLGGQRVMAAGADKVLVVVNLQGGNDGINTVVPLSQYDRYRKLRGGLAHDAADLLPLSGQPDFGLNPGMTALRDLYGQGRVAIINGVAVPHDASGLFDHSAQQYEFQSCDIARNSTTTAPTGWLGRYLDAYVGASVPPGIDMGGGRLMLTGNVCDPMTVSSIDDLQLQTSFDSDARLASYRSVMGIVNDNFVAERNRQIRIETLDQSVEIQAATAGYAPAAAYPDSYLAFSLQQCARIIYGDIGVRALTVGIGGFDTHDSENRNAYHDTLLKEVSDSVAAFYNDLAAHGLANRVLVLTMSEFGRTAYANASLGTDHGYSSVCFAVGGTVNGGVYGLYPGLDDNHLVFDGLTDITTDFRSVYATALANFAGVDPVAAVGGSFPILGYV
jgi:uncharacterized protein (DUF1501 family)